MYYLIALAVLIQNILIAYIWYKKGYSKGLSDGINGNYF